MEMVRTYASVVPSHDRYYNHFTAPYALETCSSPWCMQYNPDGSPKPLQTKEQVRLTSVT